MADRTRWKDVASKISTPVEGWWWWCSYKKSAWSWFNAVVPIIKKCPKRRVTCWTNHLWIIFQGSDKLLRLPLVWKQGVVSLKKCVWETKHYSTVSHGVILPRKLSFVCVPTDKRLTSPGSALTSRDHRQRMNPSEGDKRACEGLKVHKAFLLVPFLFSILGTVRTFECSRNAARYTWALNLTQPKKTCIMHEMCPVKHFP